MNRLLGVGLALTLSAMALPNGVAAQASIFVAGGLTVPTSDFGDFAKAGWMGHAGVLVSVGAAGLSVGADGFYGSNSHDAPFEDDKTNLYGALAFVEYTITGAGALSPYVFAGPGFMTHAFKPETGTDESDSGLALGGGVGVDIPVGGVNVFVEGMYLTGFGDVDTTRLFGINVGVGFPLGG
jgi:hypothetical protein